MSRLRYQRLVTVEAGGDGHDGEIVLVAAQRAAFRLQHADDGIIDAVNLRPVRRAGELYGKMFVASPLPSTQTLRALSTSESSSSRPSPRFQFCAGKLPGVSP